ncbi:MAG: S8 family serine peptidase, partial [Bacteroidales bacterium]|nr:S8 family serine peptidase [Bacteroidales bacterium]
MIRKTTAIILFTLFIVPIFSWGQGPATCFRIYLHDKNNNSYVVSNPAAFLSPKAIEKRARFAIPITTQDLPVSPSYINQIKAVSSNISVFTKSKWANSVVIFCDNIASLSTLSALSFVDSIVPVGNYAQGNFYNPGNKSVPENKPNSIVVNQSKGERNSEEFWGLSYAQIAMHNGHLLHNEGFKGEGMLIAVIDAGWDGMPNSILMNQMTQTGQLNGTFDLLQGTDAVFGNTGVYNMSSHGAYVTSIMAMNWADTMVGTAPNAHYVFIRSENVTNEELIEEDYWAAAAELADSLGADVINSSLGYTTFLDFPECTATYANNDGHWSIASRAATIAVQKGIIVCVAAGNEGAATFRYVSRPGDADNILTVGAVGIDSLTAGFSSIGPSFDGRVKPDVAAIGALTTYFNFYNAYPAQGNGTSFATPVIAGLAACLWQAMPVYTASHIMDIIRQSGHQYHQPDSAQGYGIPDFYQAYISHVGIIKPHPCHEVKIFPNPCRYETQMLDPNREYSSLKLYDLTGKLILQRKLTSQ